MSLEHGSSVRARLARLTTPERMWTALHWVAAIATVLAGTWSVRRVPVQADDLLALFAIESRGGQLVGEAPRRFWQVLGRFGSGQTSHFYPLGGATEYSLKRLMLRAHSAGLTANDVHQGTLSLLTIGSLVAAAHLAARLRAGVGRTAARASHFAVPIALGFVASAQVTTVWSLYDPLTVHPVYGALVTLLGLAFLLALVGHLSGEQARRRGIITGLIGVGGVCVYEGFYAFVAVGVALTIWLVWRRPSAERRHAIVTMGGWALTPPVLLIVVVRLFSAVVSTSTYRGTEMQLGGSTLTSWLTSVQTNAPGGTWGMTRRTVSEFGVEVTTPALATVAILTAAVVGWATLARRRAADDGLAGREASARALPSAVQWLVPVGIIAASTALFAASAKWGEYLGNAGYTYMGATSAWWAWAMLVGLGLERAVARARSTGAIAMLLIAVVGWCTVQIGLNDAAVRVEVAQPSPFGFDLVRLLDDGTDLTIDERCGLLLRVPQADDFPQWRDRLNYHYRIRHGEAFCE